MNARHQLRREAEQIGCTAVLGDDLLLHRKDSRLSGPIDPDATSEVAGPPPPSLAALADHPPASFAKRKTQRPTRPPRHKNHPQSTGNLCIAATAPPTHAP